ncbi:MAG TPA: glycosyltransferase family 4 protein [Candidatus Omnitrophota bacterium]|nr:glycosyltransferase family 4 protein [Candidatus Omnitrophota bacterium]
MNILIVTTHLRTGGITRYVYNLAKGLKQSGHDVWVASSGGLWEESLKEAGVQCLEIPLNTKSIVSPRVFRSFLTLRRFLKTQPMDLIHCNTRVSQFLGFLLWKFTKTPYVCTFHGYYKPRWSRRILKCGGNRTVAISRSVAEHLSGDLGIDSRGIRVVYNGVDLKGYNVKLPRDEIRRKYQISGSPVIGIVARLSAEKNHAILIRAFQRLLRDYPDAVLLIAGAGRLERELKRFVERLGLAERVIFLRDVAIPNVFAVLDVFVLASIKEGFGFAVVEAQLVGIPVIVSSAGGIKELVQDKVTGLVLRDNKNADELCDGIKLLLKDVRLRTEMVSRAREYAREMFSLEKMIEGMLRVYGEIAGKNEIS